jgi:cytochrome P450
MADLPSVDLFADDVLTDPFPIYRELRAAGPAVRIDGHDMWVLPRYPQVRAALAHHDAFSSAGVAYDDQMNEQLRGTVLASDPPEHDRLRAVLAERLAPRALRGLRVQIAAQADQLVADLVERGTFDAVSDLAEVFPVTVVAELIGLPQHVRPNLLGLADAAFDTFGPFNQRTMASMGQLGQSMGIVAQAVTREQLSPDGRAAHLYAAADRGQIDESSVFPLLTAYLIASMDTTVNAIGSAIMLLARHPEAFAALRVDDTLAGPIFEETLRLESPVQGFFRRATRDVDVDGVTVPASSRVMLLFGSANRDKAKWNRPDEFDVARNPVDHMGFGYGIHSCAGQGLARMEAAGILTALARRVASIELSGAPQRRLNNVIRGLRALPVTVHPAALT